MKVLIACEFSGVVRDAFIKQGHDAWSCDLLPTERPGPHYQGDVLDIIDNGWDLLVGHPPCTYLANSGVRWLWIKGPDGTRAPNTTRWRNMDDAATFFRTLLDAPIPRVAIENPVMHGHAAKIVGRRQDQVVQPWMFGHPEQKATCLWLKNLPKLEPTNDVREAMKALPDSERQRVFWATPSPDRWKERSITLPGIAKAMATQWGAT